MAEYDIYKNLPDQSVLHSKVLEQSTSPPAVTTAPPLDGDSEEVEKKPMNPVLKVLSWIFTFASAVLSQVFAAKLFGFFIAVGMLLGMAALFWWLTKKVISPVAPVRALLFAVNIQAVMAIMPLLVVPILPARLLNVEVERSLIIGEAAALAVITCWLALRPGYLSAIVATIYHALIVGLFIYDLFDASTEANLGEFGNIACRLLAVGLMWSGVRDNRRSARVS